MAVRVPGPYRPSGGSRRKLRSRSSRWTAITWSAVDAGHASGSARTMSAEVGGAGGGSGWPRPMAVAVVDSGGAGLDPSGVVAPALGAAAASAILAVGGLVGAVGAGPAVAASPFAESV